MKALYIHGLHSNPNPDKIKILEEAELEIIAPFIDYDKEQGAVYERIKAIAVEEQVEVLIGSSMGGFIGFWLAKDLQLAALLYNPALYFVSLQPFIPKLKSMSNPPLFFCLGEKDERVNPKEVKNYLANINPSAENIKIVNASWLEHGIDLTTFRSMTAWFLAETKKV
ncbi:MULTISPECIES: YqiA/YcfP family alpha/beta fold hydrolase [unclassified Lentimicrobium]|uniref:YqiA/YcfP family alpha/beta fold hydrolase n=1 Tax=unclassified Lentimicrobium TaxID=2677434 RepID=UPI0015539090|nr:MULTISPECIES: YqiA/YcfP family alpha/beta fold hydrolase [unclassified Lentimicrobium]NPD47153.1 hypothetical protein [Lentimicrobium sp. S6]NPD83678.1 hypothetical protein [Lentimicrobium sp. L6]